MTFTNSGITRFTRRRFWLFGRGSVTVVVVIIVIRVVILFVIILRLGGLLLRRSLLLRLILAVIGEAVAEIGRERIVRSARIVPTVGRDGRLRWVLRGRVAARGGKSSSTDGSSSPSRLPDKSFDLP